MESIKTLLNAKLGEMLVKNIGFKVTAEVDSNKTKVVIEVDGYMIIVSAPSDKHCKGTEITVHNVTTKRGHGSMVRICDAGDDISIGEVYRRARELIEMFVKPNSEDRDDP